MTDNMYLVGVVSSTHRLMGTVKLTSSFYLLEDLVGKSVMATSKDDVKLLTIKAVNNFNGKKALVDFEEINDVEEAKKLMTYKIYVRKDLVEDYEEEESYIGFKVYDNSEYIGTVEYIMDTMAHEILAVASENDKEILIPFIDVFVKEIDIEKECINVELIEGMR